MHDLQMDILWDFAEVQKLRRCTTEWLAQGFRIFNPEFLGERSREKAVAYQKKISVDPAKLAAQRERKAAWKRAHYVKSELGRGKYER